MELELNICLVYKSYPIFSIFFYKKDHRKKVISLVTQTMKYLDYTKNCQNDNIKLKKKINW